MSEEGFIRALQEAIKDLEALAKEWKRDNDERIYAVKNLARLIREDLKRGDVE